VQVCIINLPEMLNSFLFAGCHDLICHVVDGLLPAWSNQVTKTPSGLEALWPREDAFSGCILKTEAQRLQAYPNVGFELV
jgi:hypothetical protein